MTSPDLYAVLGNPIQHSQSPFIHMAFAAQTGERIEYTRLLCPLDGFKATVDDFIARGGRGCNVTIPFKFEVPALAARLSERAGLAGAGNVLTFDSDGWSADNSDGIGLVRDIEQAGVALAGQRVLMIGAGGGAAGALGPIIAARVAELVVANRTLSKAEALVDRHRAWAARHGVALAARPVDDPGAGYDVVVNAAATSLQGALPPVGPQVFAPGALAVDMMYGPAAAPFIGWAEQHGARGRDGLGMLVEQAAEAFQLWRGVRPHTPPVLAALRDVLARGAQR